MIFSGQGCFKKNRISPLATLLKKKGWLTQEDIDKVPVAQEETAEKFGQNAIKLGYLDKDQVEELLSHQKKEHLFFGQALVQLGLITETQLLENLKEFEKLKSGKPE